MASSWLRADSRAPAPTRPGAVLRPACLLLPILIVLLPLFPPETRGEAMAGVSVLVALLAILVPPGDGDAVKGLVLGFALAGGALAFLVPVPAVQPMAVALVAATAGAHLAGLPRAFRWGPAVPISLSLAGAAVSLHALEQKLWGLHALAEQVRATPGVPDRDVILGRLAEGRAFAAFPTPAALGGFLVLALPVTVAEAFRAGRRARIALAVAAVLEVAGLLCAASVTAAAALLGALLIAAVSLRVSRRRLVLGGVSLLLIVAAIAALRGGEVLDRGRPDSPWLLRAGNFRAAWEMAVDHPWVGVGPSRFGGALPRYLRPGENETRYAHDLPLQLAAETGFPAAVLLSAVFFALFLAPLLSRRAGDGPPWLDGASIGLASFALQNLVDFTAFLPSMLWLAASVRGAASSGGGDVENPPLRRSGGAIRWPIVAFALAAAAVTACSGLGWNARTDARGKLADGDFAGAIGSARRATSLAPWDTEASTVLAQALLSRSGAPGGSPGDLRDALAEADRAVSLDSARPGTRDLRARIRATAGDLPGAYADLAEAASSYPLRKDFASRRDRMMEALPGLSAAERRP
jgi:hypothetical protein